MYLRSKGNPIREALSLLCGGKRPPSFVKGYDLSGLTDAQIHELQDWCATNCEPDWATGIGTLDAAELIVNEALANANIKRPPNTTGSGEKAK